MYHHWGCTEIYQPLSYPLISIAILLAWNMYNRLRKRLERIPNLCLNNCSKYGGGIHLNHALVLISLQYIFHGYIFNIMFLRYRKNLKLLILCSWFISFTFGSALFFSGFKDRKNSLNPAHPGTHIKLLQICKTQSVL